MSVGLGDDGRLVVEAAVPATPRPVAVPDRAAYWLLVTLMIGFSFKGLLNLPAGWALLPGACFLGAACAMQLHWAWRERPRSGPWALAVLALLSLAPLPLYGEGWLGAAGFLIGPLLLALPARFSWPLSGAVLIATAAAGWQLGLPAGRTANFVVSALVNGLIVYGLVRLAQLIRTLQAAADELARTAMVQERLRAARDLHDLLGHSLAAILLKCELARRLAGRDPVRARAELDDVLAMTERARADMRAVSGAAPEMSLEAEAESARSVLAAAGVETELEQARAPLPPDVSTVLSTVLREAVTNTLRHSAARHCRITISADPESVRLTVENDGLPAGAGDRPPGSGLGNLTTRLAALGGSLTARRTAEGWFRLTASVPVPGSEARPQPARAAPFERRAVEA